MPKPPRPHPHLSPTGNTDMTIASHTPTDMLRAELELDLPLPRLGSHTPPSSGSESTKSSSSALPWDAYDHYGSYNDYSDDSYTRLVEELMTFPDVLPDLVMSDLDPVSPPDLNSLRLDVIDPQLAPGAVVPAPVASPLPPRAPVSPLYRMGTRPLSYSGPSLKASAAVTSPTSPSPSPAPATPPSTPRKPHPTPRKTTPRKPAPRTPKKKNSGQLQWVNYSPLDGERLSAGVAPSGGRAHARSHSDTGVRKRVSVDEFGQ